MYEKNPGPLQCENCPVHEQINNRQTDIQQRIEAIRDDGHYKDVTRRFDDAQYNLNNLISAYGWTSSNPHAQTLITTNEKSLFDARCQRWIIEGENGLAELRQEKANVSACKDRLCATFCERIQGGRRDLDHEIAIRIAEIMASDPTIQT